MIEIIPALLVKTEQEFSDKLRLIEGLVPAAQLDCMDGHFVPNQTWYEAHALNTTLKLELHLMVSDPLTVIREWKKIEQTVRVLWQIEIPVDHAAMIDRCRALGLECGLALSPKTPVQALSAFHEKIDEVLILGVEPGWSGQDLINSSLGKIKEVKDLNPALRIGFDGGVNRSNLQQLIGLGADRINIASGIFGAPDPRAELRAILEAI